MVLFKMGYGKYTREEKDIVKHIEILKQRQFYYKRKFNKLKKEIDELLLKVPQCKYKHLKITKE